MANNLLKLYLPFRLSLFHHENIMYSSLSTTKFDSQLQVFTEAEEGQSKNILQLQKNILNRNVFLKSLSKSLTNLKNYCKS